MPDLGVYLLDEEYRYITANGRAEIYIYGQKGCNPISILALIDIQRYLETEQKKQLEIKDLTLFVDKIRQVEIGKTLIQTIKRDIENMQKQGGEGLSEQEQAEVLRDYLKDNSFDYTVEKLTQLSRPRNESAKLSDHTIAWLNAYFKEDVVSRYYLLMRQLTDEKFKLPESREVTGAASFFSPAAGKRAIALVCINNAMIDFDVKVKVQMNNEKGHYELTTKKYDNFNIKESKARYRHGKQSIYTVLIDTKTKEAEHVPNLEAPKVQTVPEQLPAQVLHESGPVVTTEIAPPKKKMGRKPGTKNRDYSNLGAEAETETKDQEGLSQ